MSYIFWPENPNLSLDECGGKALALWKLQTAAAQHGAAIPEWFVISPRAFEGNLTDEQRRDLFDADASAQQQALASVKPLSPLSDAGYELLNAMLRLCPRGESVAVRSSARDEDGAQHSFAGQFHSALCVPSEGVSAVVVDVWLSAWNQNNISYRKTQGVSEIYVPAVLVQRMVNAESAGVAFSADPVSGLRDICLVSAVHGLGSALVDGSSDADEFRVQDNKIIETKIAHKNIAHRPMPNCVRTENNVEAIAQNPALNEEQVIKIANLARGVAEHFGSPQDIEWAIENGRLYLLQARPITALPEEERLNNSKTLTNPEKQGELRLWDNSNIIESYPGITSPLTFSFARRAYEEVYRQFCKLLGVSQNKIAAHDSTFKQMLGLLQGRVYYNLLNWYRLLQLLPGFQVNRRFMEQMMGVRESLPDEFLAPQQTSTQQERVLDGLNLLRSCVGLVWSYATLERSKEKFYQRVEDALHLSTPLEDLSADELAAYYRSLEIQLLSKWDAPLINDFFAMIFHGVLRRLCAKWCGDESLSNALLCGKGDMVSAEPLQRLKVLARLISSDTEFAQKLSSASWPKLKNEIAERPEFLRAFEQYLERFGERCFEELKLESPTLNDDPTPLLQSIGQMAFNVGIESQSGAALVIREAAEAQVETTLSQSESGWQHVLRRPAFRYVMRQARERVRDRENLRFERTRVFGRVRRIFVELGKRLHDARALTTPQDIFYLEVEEILGFIEGTTTLHSLSELVSLRRCEYEKFAQKKPLPDRFSTHGSVALSEVEVDENSSQNTSSPEHEEFEEMRRGTACCAGVVKGRARVIREPRGAVLQAGEILVAPRTDPGWVTLFANASGLIVERGSLLSHSAIVAREMGLPAVVSLPDATLWLQNGDLIELDGKTGIVRRLERAGSTL